jgi:hypothetical protein
LGADPSETVFACIRALDAVFTGSDCRGCRTHMREALRVAMRNIFEVLDLHHVQQ